MARRKKLKPINKSASEDYSVVKFYENDSLLFECIPNVWFTDEEKTSCYWPPKTGATVWARALKRELPDESYEIYVCEVVSEGLGKCENIFYSVYNVYVPYTVGCSKISISIAIHS